MQFAFFLSYRHSKAFWKIIDFVENLEIANSRGNVEGAVGVMFFASLWLSAYENWYVIHSLAKCSIWVSVCLIH